MIIFEVFFVIFQFEFIDLLENSVINSENFWDSLCLLWIYKQLQYLLSLELNTQSNEFCDQQMCLLNHYSL